MFHLIFKTVRFICYSIDLVLIIVLAFLCSFIPYRINKYFMHLLFRGVCWSFINFIGRAPHIHQKYTPPLPKQYILISNHPSGYDLLILNAIFPVVALAQSGVAKWFLVGRIAKSIGVVFVERESKGSRNAAKTACTAKIKEGKNVLIYPEGGCFGKHLRPFKYGAFDISMSTNIPILPIYLQYEAENAFEWGDHGLLYHLYRMMKSINKHTHCYIFDPIYPEPFSTPETYAKHVHDKYRKWEEKYRL